MNESAVLSLLERHVPPAALSYCLRVWQNTPFDLKITRSRQSKVGDFTCRLAGKPQITLNHDLNPYLFVTTYIHEVAHLRVFLQYGNRVEPHGEKWKSMFQRMLEPLLITDNIYPVELLHILRLHMVNPKASSFSDSELTRAFRQYDPDKGRRYTVEELPTGSVFKLNSKYFQKGTVKRTRVVCKELKSKRLYLVPLDAVVTDVQLSLL